MTPTLFAYPPNAAFGRVLPKNKIYEHAGPTRATKELFIRQVEQIVWQYKLAPETINIAGTPAVPEIQVFSVDLKDGELRPEVLRCIDLAIPFPIIFELRFNDRVRPIAACKRPNEADSAKWVISDYFGDDWLPGNTPRQSLPVAFDLAALHGQLLQPLMPYPARPGELLHAQVARTEQILRKQRELEKATSRLRKERQFNRQVAINAELRRLKLEIEELARALPAGGGAVAP